jgi:hypothetical protein
MDILFAIIAALVGWQHGRFGRHELKGIAVVVLGWTAVTTVAALPGFSLLGIAAALIVRILIVGGGYGVGVLLHRWRKPRR